MKFADSDLIGLPLRITIGKKASEGIVEVKFRQSGESTEWQVEEITEKLQDFSETNKTWREGRNRYFPSFH